MIAARNRIIPRIRIRLSLLLRRIRSAFALLLRLLISSSDSLSPGFVILCMVPLFSPLFPCRLHTVIHQHCNCHRSYSPGYRCDCFCLFFHMFKIHISAQLSVFIPVHPDINDNGSLFDIVRLNQLRSVRLLPFHSAQAGEAPSVSRRGCSVQLLHTLFPRLYSRTV